MEISENVQASGRLGYVITVEATVVIGTATHFIEFTPIDSPDCELYKIISDRA